MIERIKCVVSYDGSDFYGFQIQPGKRTVQGDIQAALKRICNEEITIHASGRTDANVHGIGQVFHFDTTRTIDVNKWKVAINHFLPNDIYVSDVCFVSQEFHSRYSAIEKEYHYKLSTNEFNVFNRNYCLQYGRKLDVEKMQEAALIFIGEHDFKSFCSYDEYGNTIRNIYKFDIEECDGEITFKVSGNGFRRYMVRHLVGGLIQVGACRMSFNQLENLLLGDGTKKCLHKAKPQGLYLYKVTYQSEG